MIAACASNFAVLARGGSAMSPRQNWVERRRGFTVVELLVVIGIIASLMALLIPAVQRVREGANRIACLNNLRQMGLGAQECNDMYGKLPPMLGYYPFEDRNAYGGLLFHLLPFIEQADLYNATYDPDTRFYDVRHNHLYTVSVRTYLCPADPSILSNTASTSDWAPSSYAANYLVFGLGGRQTWQGRARIPQSFRDGTSNTILVGEKYAHCHDMGTAWARIDTDAWQPAFGVFAFGPQSKFQIQPSPFDGDACDPRLASTAHPGGMQVCLADGSGRSISPQISPDTWWAACTPADGESMGSDW
jgi:prepilin-type N-terminal cleavage/methylation domain-containing protein